MRLQETLKLYNNKDYNKAFQIFYEHAINGEKIAQYYLGLLYNRGHGVEANQKESFNCFLKAAKQGHGDSQYIVGIAYSGRWTSSDKNILLRKDNKIFRDEFDEGDYVDEYPTPYVERDDNESFRWLLEANKNFSWGTKKHIRYNFDLLTLDISTIGDYIYYNDRISVLSEDVIQKFIDFFINEYNNGDHKVADIIGMLHENKYGDFHNYDGAYAWYKIGSQKHRLPFSTYRLAGLYYEGLGIPKNKKIASLLYIGALEYGYPDYRFQGYYYIGRTLEEGPYEEIKDSPLTAFIKGSELNDELSEKVLKEYYDSGHTINDKYDLKFSLLKEGLAGDHEARRKFINIFLKNNDGLSWGAHKWLIEYADNGDSESIKLLFKLYYDYLDMRDETQESFDFKVWFAKKGDLNYRFRLSQTYKYGNEFVEKDNDKAAYWYEMAKEGNNAENKKDLEKIMNIVGDI